MRARPECELVAQSPLDRMASLYCDGLGGLHVLLLERDTLKEAKNGSNPTGARTPGSLTTCHQPVLDSQRQDLW